MGLLWIRDPPLSHCSDDIGPCAHPSRQEGCWRVSQLTRGPLTSLPSQPSRSPPAQQGTGKGLSQDIQRSTIVHGEKAAGELVWGEASLAPDPNTPSCLEASCAMEKLTQIFLSNADGPTSTRRPQSTKSFAFSRAVPRGTPRLGRRMAWTVCPPWGRPRTSTVASSPPETSQVTPFLCRSKFLPLDFFPILVPWLETRSVAHQPPLHPPNANP